MFPRDRLKNATLAQASKRPPPDFQSRSARLRLFTLVAALMAVLVAMNEARKPGTWSWLWHGQDLADPTAPSQDQQTINTRLSATQEPIDEESAKTPKPQLPKVTQLGDQLPNTAGELDALVDQQYRLAWKHIWEALDYHERGQLARLLRAARRGTSPAQSVDRSQSVDPSTWQAFAKQLDRIWSDLVQAQGREVLIPVMEMSGEQRQLALKILAELEIRWHQQLKPAWEAAAAGRAWTESERVELGDVQKIIDQIALEDVRDDTVWRAAERTAWFRLLEHLQQSTLFELQQQSAGEVGFVQIFRQPSEYRGKVVTVQGTARLAYRVVAPPNDLGIREYCLFWLQPEDGTNRPIVVYALEPPPGFPTITREKQTIREPLEVTGFFFKRWVYQAADGLNSVPLIVAKEPTWSPPPPSEPTAKEQLSEWLGPWYWPALLSAAALLACAVFGVARWIKGPAGTSPLLAELRGETPDGKKQSPAWDNLPATPSIQESLRKLSEPGNRSSGPE